MGRCGLALILALAAAPASAAELRVCADPNNMPFSNAKGEGFENKIVERIAADWGRTLKYTWWAQRRGNVRSTLKAGECDLNPGIGSCGPSSQGVGVSTSGTGEAFAYHSAVGPQTSATSIWPDATARTIAACGSASP
jgi:hypothetical protein